MKQRVERVGWWLHRLRAKRFVAFVLIVAVAASAGWIYGGRDSAALGGVAALVLAGILLARPLAALAKRLFMRTPPWRAQPGPLAFANADLGFWVEGFVDGRSPRELVDTIAVDTLEYAGGRFSSGEIGLQLWMVATDDQGQDWTIVQEIEEAPTGTVAWTSSVDAELTAADFDDTLRPNPFRAAHRLVAHELDVPVVDIEVLGWGRERHATGTRDTVVAFARTSLGAEGLSSTQYPEGLDHRAAHLVPVSFEGVAETLGWGPPLHWRGGSVFGLLELLEIYQSGAWAALDRRIAPRWHEKGMFARVERETKRGTEQALVTPF